MTGNAPGRCNVAQRRVESRAFARVPRFHQGYFANQGFYLDRNRQYHHAVRGQAPVRKRLRQVQ